MRSAHVRQQSPAAAALTVALLPQRLLRCDRADAKIRNPERVGRVFEGSLACIALTSIYVTRARTLRRSPALNPVLIPWIVSYLDQIGCRLHYQVQKRIR